MASVGGAPTAPPGRGHGSGGAARDAGIVPRSLLRAATAASVGASGATTTVGGSQEHGGQGGEARGGGGSGSGTTEWKDVNVAKFAAIGTGFIVGLETGLYPMFTVATRMQFENQVRPVWRGAARRVRVLHCGAAATCPATLRVCARGGGAVPGTRTLTACPVLSACVCVCVCVCVCGGAQPTEACHVCPRLL